MTVLNELDRFHLALAVMRRVPGLDKRSRAEQQTVHDKLTEHRAYVNEHGQDMPQIRNWRWQGLNR
jgi:xylulose-5-phosphate/fructose-6-phosphate phosphoketolase